MTFWLLTGCFLIGPGPTEGRNPGECSDAADNDGDGDFDCDDEDCSGSPDCADPTPTEPPASTPAPTGDTGEPVPESTLVLDWAFDNGLSCTANDVDAIDVAVLQSRRLQDGFPRTFPCEVGTATFVGVPTGPVTVDLIGVDDASKLLFTGSADADLPVGDTTAVSVELMPVP